MITNKYLPESFRIEEVKQIDSHRFILTIKNENNIKPGQFFMLAIPNYKEVSVFAGQNHDGLVDIQVKRPSKVKEEIFSKSKGRYFYIRGPYGNGLEMEADKDHIIIITDEKGLTVAKSVIKYYEKKEAKIDFIYFSDTDQNIKEARYFENFDRQVINKIKIEDIKSTFILIYLKDEFMKIAAEEMVKKGIPQDMINVILKRNIVCGMGKCGHCRSANIYSCTDGPVFKYGNIKNLID